MAQCLCCEFESMQWPGFEKHKEFGDQYGLCSGGTKKWVCNKILLK